MTDDILLASHPTAPTHRAPAHLVAGLDVMASSERAAEHQLALVAAAAREVGAQDITTATHRATVFPTPHVSMSISMSTELSPRRMLEFLADLLAVEDGAAGSVTLGERGVGLPALQVSASAAGAAHRNRLSGRVVEFPGSGTLTGTVRFGQVLDTAIERVDALGGEPPLRDSPLVTGDFVRPCWHGGELVLHVRPAVDGTWVPVGTPHPTPCGVAYR